MVYCALSCIYLTHCKHSLYIHSFEFIYLFSSSWRSMKLLGILMALLSSTSALAGWDLFESQIKNILSTNSSDFVFSGKNDEGRGCSFIFIPSSLGAGWSVKIYDESQREVGVFSRDAFDTVVGGTGPDQLEKSVVVTGSNRLQPDLQINLLVAYHQGQAAVGISGSAVQAAMCAE